MNALGDLPNAASGGGALRTYLPYFCTLHEELKLTVGFNSKLGASTVKFKLRCSSKSYRLVAKHMAAFILLFGVYTLVLSGCSKDNIKVFAAPGSACHVVGREDYVFQVLTSWREDHDAIRRENRNPQIAIGAAHNININIFYQESN